MIQAQKITRLEASLKVYEDEIRRLTEKVIELEEQILTLEHKNGRLIMDSNQNVSLKFKIQKLQEGMIYSLCQLLKFDHALGSCCLECVNSPFVYQLR